MPVPAKYYSQCYVDFKSEQDANHALIIDRKVIEGKTIFVAISKPPEKYDNLDNTLYLNNLPFNLSKEELMKELSFCKEDIVDARIFKSYAFVRFKDEFTMKKNHRTLKNFFIKGRRIVAKKAEDKREIKTELNKRSKMDSPAKSVSIDQTLNNNHIVKKDQVNANLGKRNLEQPDFNIDSKYITEKEKNIDINNQITHTKPSETSSTTLSKPKNNSDFRTMLKLK